MSINGIGQVDTAKVFITRRRIIQVENMERNHPKGGSSCVGYGAADDQEINS